MRWVQAGLQFNINHLHLKKLLFFTTFGFRTALLKLNETKKPSIIRFRIACPTRKFDLSSEENPLFNSEKFNNRQPKLRSVRTH